MLGYTLGMLLGLTWKYKAGYGNSFVMRLGLESEIWCTLIQLRVSERIKSNTCLLFGGILALLNSVNLIYRNRPGSDNTKPYVV